MRELSMHETKCGRRETHRWVIVVTGKRCLHLVYDTYVGICWCVYIYVLTALERRILQGTISRFNALSMRTSETDAPTQDDSALPVIPIMLRCNMSFGTRRLRIREIFSASDRGAGTLEIVQDHRGDAIQMSAGFDLCGSGGGIAEDGSDDDEEDLGEEVTR